MIKKPSTKKILLATIFITLYLNAAEEPEHKKAIEKYYQDLANPQEKQPGKPQKPLVQAAQKKDMAMIEFWLATGENGQNTLHEAIEVSRKKRNRAAVKLLFEGVAQNPS